MEKFEPLGVLKWWQEPFLSKQGESSGRRFRELNTGRGDLKHDGHDATITGEGTLGALCAIDDHVRRVEVTTDIDEGIAANGPIPH